MSHHDDNLESLIRHHVAALAGRIGPRPTGSPGNQRAGAYLKEMFARSRWQVDCPSFDCLTWQGGRAALEGGGRSFQVQPNPYSPPFEGCYPLVVCHTTDELAQRGSLNSRVLLLAGALSEWPYMPKNFPFVTFEEQQQAIRLIEAAAAEAVLAVGPAPVFCDADFHLPSATVSPSEGEAISGLAGSEVALRVEGQTVSSTGFNVIARSAARSDRKLVICAHYDTWFDTPGAIDNAGGVAALLGLAAALDPAICPAVEMVAFSGEDHYAAPGEAAYLAPGIDDIGWVINIDGIGARGKQTSLSFYGDAPALFEQVRSRCEAFPQIVETDPWPQGDHSIFVGRGIPAIALSSTDVWDLTPILHSTRDTPDQVDPALIAEVVTFLRALSDLST